MTQHRLRCACKGCPDCNHIAGRQGCNRRPKVIGPCRTCWDADRAVGWPPAVTRDDPPTLFAFGPQAVKGRGN